MLRSDKKPNWGKITLNSKMRVTSSFLFILLGSAVLVAGCGPTSASTASKDSAEKTQAETLVLYSAQGYDSAMATAFEKKTGIKVQLVDDSTGNIVAKMEAEKSNPHWDVAWFDGDSTMQGLDNEGMLLKGWTPNDVSNYTSYGQSLIPSDKAYYPASITAAAAIAYNTKLVPPNEAPKDWSDLLKPQFKSALAMNDPSISGPTFPFVAGMFQLMGNQNGEEFFHSLKQNGMRVFPTNDNTLKALVGGQVKAIMIQDSALIDAKVKGDPIQIVYPSSGVFSLPGEMAIDKSAPDMAAAKQFIEFVLSQEGQQVMLNPQNGGGDSYFNPIVKGVQPNPARQQSGIKWVPVDPVKAAQDENQIKQWFH